VLQLIGVAKSFKGVPALHPLDLTIPEGKTTALIGPSGCGKSTLLRLLVGLIRPDSGQVFFRGEPLTPGNARRIRRQLGYVVQDGGLFPHLTARGNVTLMARLSRTDPAKVEKRICELTDLTHFPAEKLNAYPAQLSGGQRQRVSLMRALLLEPEVLLLDEPLGALDPLVRSELQSDLREVFAALKKTVVLVTHDLGEAGYLGDQLVLLRGGRIIQNAPFAELLEQPADEFVTRFINAQRPPPGLVEERR
jgi:osmoprotectant transport system ATP-binding protein